MPFITWQNRRILFIHIPKTGGSSIEHWLGSFAPLQFLSVGVPAFSQTTPQHLTYTDLRSLFTGDFFDYGFTVVRDPYRRIESEFRMRATLAQEGYWGGTLPFSSWLEINLDAADRHKWHLDSHLRRQVDFLGENIRVFRFEDGIAQALRRVARECGLAEDWPVGHFREGQKSAATVTWGPQDIARVNAFYAADFTAFGYPMRPVLASAG